MSHDGPVLYGYWRSTAAYRVRIALNLKGIDYRHETIDLVRDGGEQLQPAYREVNPAALVPSLRIDGQVLTQSLAICEYLDETRSGPPLLPKEPHRRAFARALALDVACDVHPINNLRVQKYLRSRHGVDDEGLRAWMDHWMQAGFAGMQARLDASSWTGRCCIGDAPGIADIFLVAQAYNADRFGSDLTAYPTLNRIIAECRSLPEFRAAEPERQPDAPAV